MSTRSSRRVDPTVNVVWHEPHVTCAWWYSGWMSDFTSFLSGRCCGRLCRIGGGALGDDADALLVAADVLEADAAVDRREDGVVATQTGAIAGQERHAALPDDDRAGAHELAVACLHAEAL